MRNVCTTGAAVLVVLLWTPGVGQAQGVDPQFRADIERLMVVTGSGDVAVQMANLVSGQMIDALKQSRPNVPDRAIEIIKEVLNSEFSKAFSAPGGLQVQLTDIYAKYFTHDEVIALLNFYATPVGQKAISVMPQLMREGATVGQAWGKANMDRIGAVLQQRLRAEGLIN